MADDELKNMVMSFRVSELQVLLGYAGRCKTGRKSELLSRALQLIQNRVSTPVEMKIMELYRRRFPNGKSPVRPQNIGSTMSVPPSSASSSVPMDYSGYSSSSGSSSMPIHPDVRLKRLPFYDIRGELLKPATLVPKSNTRFQETYFVFHLTPQQANEILQSRSSRLDRPDYNVQIQLRFCLLETSCPQEDNFPPSICVRVNSKLAPLPNPIPTNKPGMEPRRPSRPVNITHLCRLSPTVPNQVTVSWASEYARSYCISVSLVQRLCSDVLLQRLKQKGIRHPDHSRAMIKEKLATDPDSEIATTSLKVTLNCPLGKMKMGIPTRATTCNHLQCYDASTYLQMNEKKATWVCPVCDKPAEFDNLVIDGYFTEILKQAPDTSEIQFSEDGNWHPMKPKELYSADVSSSPVIQSIADDSPKKENNDVIDLTETDDEEPQVTGTTDLYTELTSPESADGSSVSSSSDSDSDESVVPIAGSSSGGASNSPPIISIDSSPHVSPQCRTPQRSVTPLSGPSTPVNPSPISPQQLSPVTPVGSPFHRSPIRHSPISPPTLTHHSISPSLLRMSPQDHHSPMDSLPPLSSTLPMPNFPPPPAHSHGALVAPHIPPHHMSSMFDMSDSDMDDIFNYMSGSRSLPYHTPFYNPYTHYPPFPLSSDRSTPNASTSSSLYGFDSNIPPAHSNSNNR